ncbi:methionyl-tRNA formyltransferase [Candidatus Microgenomates bacterium]|nr:methionyl-tRNA formyltransferase [Candidatus Microgenomates bacterium]
MQKIKTAYFGTPDFAAEFLGKILGNSELPIEIVCVFTQPDSRVGRKQVVTKTPVRELAEQHGIPVHTDLNNAVEVLKQVDLALLFAYGEIIPPQLLAAPRFGFWNIHPSLLPKYRGPAPMATPLLHGDNETGVTLMQMDEEMDHGPIIAQVKSYIFPVWRRDQLEKHLIDLGFELFKKVIESCAPDLSNAPKIDQNHQEATVTKRMNRDDGYIPLEDLKNPDPAKKRQIFNMFRAYYPWPGVWTRLRLKAADGQADEKRLKLTKIHWENDDLVIKKVQLEGKNEVELKQFEDAYGPLMS